MRSTLSGIEALEAELEAQEGNGGGRSKPATRRSDHLEINEQQDSMQKMATHEDVAEALLREEEEAEDGEAWYLAAAQEGEAEANPFAERQRLPDLPPNPPPILQPLLKQISVDLGMDYLNVIDLRVLDPPPALGANLIMIFGTARSEKHLNVSADRLCRWLRTNYKLTPNADGLLGRNELKLKLRRKARRLRMLGAAGAVETPNADDGITTGWVCVNVGSVENGPNASQQEQHKGFVGFGTRSGQAKIVVQMMTEEKRSEVDLEALWQGTLEREHRKMEGERRAWEKLDQAKVDGSNEVRNDERHRSQQTFPPSVTAPYPAQHVRRFHSSTRHHRADDVRSTTTEELDEDELEPHLLPDELQPQKGLLSDTVAALTLRTHVDYIKTLRPSVAMSMLGTGANDHNSTSFLRTFHAAIPAFPELRHYVSLVDLYCHALSIGAPGYDRRDLLNLYNRMQASGFAIPESTFHQGLSAILLSPHTLSPTFIPRDPAFNGRSALQRSLGISFELLEQMEANGHEPRSESILLLILDAISTPTFLNPSNTPDTDRMYLATHDLSKFLHQYRRAILHQPSYTGAPSNSSSPLTSPIHGAVSPSTLTTIHTALLRIALAHTLPSEIWAAWRALPRFLLPRTAEMYGMMFNGIADVENQKVAMMVLETCVPEMAREVPQVRMEGEVARGVVRLLKVARVDVGVWPWRGWFEGAREGLGMVE